MMKRDEGVSTTIRRGALNHFLAKNFAIAVEKCSVPEASYMVRMVKVLMIIGHEGFRDEEYFEPKKVFENANFEVTTCAKQSPAVSKISKEHIEADVLFEELFQENSKPAEDFDAVTFVGGPGAETFLHDKNAHKLAWDFYNAGKLVTAICLSPVILANAGLLIGKKATVWSGVKQDLCAGHCLYQESGVAVDGRIITASGPETATEFAEKITELLSRSS